MKLFYYRFESMSLNVEATILAHDLEEADEIIFKDVKPINIFQREEIPETPSRILSFFSSRK